MKPTKACPVVLRFQERAEILVFEHPLAGIQLVKGTIEPSETSKDAALRELMEESGIAEARWVRDLGVWNADFRDQIWSFNLCVSLASLPDTWAHHAADDDGKLFRFSWHPLSKAPSNDWHLVFQRALRFIQDIPMSQLRD